MSTKHTTKNGLTITTDRGVHILEAGGATAFMDSLVWEDLKEYFQHEQDAEYERWRDPHDPDKVVYKNTEDSIRVLDESTGEVDYWSRDEASLQTGESSDSLTARRYFEAHPPSKPWDNPNPGEIWELTLRDETRAYIVDTDFFKDAFTGRIVSPFEEYDITASKRIWPQLEEGDK